MLVVEFLHPRFLFQWLTLYHPFKILIVRSLQCLGQYICLPDLGYGSKANRKAFTFCFKGLLRFIPSLIAKLSGKIMRTAGYSNNTNHGNSET